MPNEREIIRLVTERISRFPDIRLAILYGSVIRETMHTGSDVDLAVAGDVHRSLDPELLLDVSLDLGVIAQREVQIRDLARAHGLFLMQVLSTGLILVDRDPAIRGALIVRMLDFEADMLPNIRMIRSAVTERFLAG